MTTRAILAAVLLWLPASPAPAAEPFVLNPNGGWCWFQDERAVVSGEELAAASITREGDVQVTAWNFRAGSLRVETLRPDFDGDDHNVASLLPRADGRLMAFYAKHGDEAKMYYRVATSTGAWEPEVSFDAGVTDGFTYSNPFQLSAERGRIYLFWRGIHWNPTWSSSDDNGRTWRQGANHIYFKKGERPYVKYASNGRDVIHFAFTEGHPNRPYPTSLHHAYYRGGVLYTSGGKAVRKLVDGPIRPEEATKVYDGASIATGEAWVWDIALDSSERPVIAYSSVPGPMDHRYRYARWNGKQWEDRQIAFAGKRLYEREGHYSGGISLDPDDTRIVYFSSDVDILTGKPNASGHFEIYKGVTPDGGETWKWQPVTRNSSKDNLRPIVPSGHPRGTFVLWLRGLYRTYTDYATEVVAFTGAKGAGIPR